MVEFRLNNQIVPTGLTEWEETEVNATFNDEGVNAVVEISEATFSGDEYKIIDEYIQRGKSGYDGIFQGMPFSMRLFNKDNSFNAFEGFVNFKEEYKELFAGKVTTKINSNDDILTLQEQLESITYGLLYDQNIITNNDIINVDFLVQKYEQETEFILLAITTFIMVKELVESAKRVVDDATNLIKAVTPNVGVGVSADIGDIISLAILLAANILYTVLILIQLIKLGEDLLDFIYPPIRKHKAIRFTTLLQKACEKLGYGFSTGIEELSEWVFIPSIPDDDISENRGVPRPSDRGYVCSEMFQLVKDMFKAVITFDGTNVQLRSMNDPYFINTTEYILPDVLLEEKEYNAKDLKGNQFWKFETDVSDKWTSVDYKGNSYAINTTLKNESKYNLITGFERVDFGVCLGNRKESLDQLEIALNKFFQTIDEVIKAFGGNSKLASKIQKRIYVLKQTERTHSIAKVCKLNGSRLVPKNEMSAKYLYDNYLNYDSFVLNGNYGQKRVFSEIEIPFCLNDFLKTIKNSYFRLSDGREGKFTSLKWEFAKDKATVSFWIREVYTTNLKEIGYEAS